MPRKPEVIPWKELITARLGYEIMRILRDDEMGYFERRAAAKLDRLLAAIPTESTDPSFAFAYACAWFVLQNYCLKYALPYLKKHGQPPIKET